MACVLPPEPDDSALLAYLDGEADEQVAEHLELCPHCRARAERLPRLQQYLTAGLRQNVCPEPVVLGEYLLGLMPDDWTSALEQHLAECPHCATELAQLKADLHELDADLAFRPLERIRVWFAQLVSGGREPGEPGMPALAPAYAGVRGEEEPPRIYEAGDAKIAIQIQPDAEQPDRKALVGLVTGIEPIGLRVYLWQAKEQVGEVSVDESGNFALGGLLPACYELILSGAEVEIHVQELAIGTD